MAPNCTSHVVVGDYIAMLSDTGVGGWGTVSYGESKDAGNHYVAMKATMDPAPEPPQRSRVKPY